jgi:hypothetical protein
MKVNPILLIIAIALAALVAYGFYAGNDKEAYRLLIAFGAGLSMSASLGTLLAFSVADRGGSLNIKIVSLLFFLALLVEHLIFSFTKIRVAPYIIITGILLFVYALIAYAIMRALK